MPIPSHKHNFPVTLDRAMLSRLDRIAKGCRLHRSSVLSGLIAEGLESLEARYEHRPDDLRLELGEAVHALRREIARQRMWELFQDVRCSTNAARERSVMAARRQAEREVGLPIGTLDRPKQPARHRRDQRDKDARRESFARPSFPAATDSASSGQQSVVGVEGQGGGGERVDLDASAPLPADPSPSRDGPRGTDGVSRNPKASHRSPRAGRHERGLLQRGEGARAGRHYRARVARMSFAC